MATHLRAYDASGNALGLLPDHRDMRCQFTHNDPDTLTFSYLVNGQRASLFDRDDLQLAIVEDGVEWPQRFVLDDDGDDEADDAGDARLMTVAARGTMAVLERAVIYPEAHVPGGPVNGLEMTHVFTNQSPGAIMKTLIDKAKARGALTGLTYNFTATHDSAGVAWPKFLTQTYTAGLDYLKVLSALCDNGHVDARMTGMQLNLYVPDTAAAVYRPNVLLRLNQHVTSGPRKRSRRGIFSHMLGHGAEGVGVEVSDSTAQAKYGRREGYAADGRMTEAGSLMDMASFELKSHTDAKEAISLEVVLNAPPGESWPKPRVDYTVGDFIHYDRRRVSATEYEKLRVRTLTWTWGSASSPASCTVELNDVFVESSIKLARRVQGILNGSVTTSPPPDKPPIKDVMAPAAPSVVAIEGLTYLDGTMHRSSATVTWPAVTKNGDGTECDDLSGYLVSWRVGTSGQWSAARTSTDTAEWITNLRPGTTIFARVLAFDRDDNKSEWTVSEGYTLPLDTEPPVKSSAPVLSTIRGTVAVQWDGKDYLGQPVVGDFSHVEIQACADSAFAEGTVTVVGRLGVRSSWPVTTQTYGVPVHYRLVAVDTSGNRAEPSDSGSIATSPLVSGDLATSIIDQIAQASSDAADAKSLVDDLAIDVGSKVPSVSGGAGTKVFRNVLQTPQLGGALGTGTVVIHTPITMGDYMVRLSLRGFEYRGAASDIALEMAFYAYSTGPAFINAAASSSGSFAIAPRLAIDAAGKVVILLDSPDGEWHYTRVEIPEVSIGLSTPPDSYLEGWTAGIETDLSGYTGVVSPVQQDLYFAAKLALGWKNPTPGVTTIDGGNITADTVGTEALMAGSIGVKQLAVGDTGNMAAINTTYPGRVTYDGWTDEAFSGADGKTWSRRSPAATTSRYFMFRPQAGPLQFKPGDRIRMTFEAYGSAAGPANFTAGVWTQPSGASFGLIPVPGTPALTLTATPQTFVVEGDVPVDVDNDTSFIVGIESAWFANAGIKPYVRNVRVYRMGAGELVVDGSIRGRHIAVNSVEADRIATGQLAVDAEIVAGPPDGTHASLSGTGFRAFTIDNDGNVRESVRMGTSTNDLFAIMSADGSVKASVSEEGVGSFTDLAVDDGQGTARPTVNGAPLLGTQGGNNFEIFDFLNDPTWGRDLELDPLGHMESYAKGNAIWHQFYQHELPQTAGPSAFYHLFDISFDLEPGRQYAVTVPPITIQGGTSGGTMQLILFYTTDGTMPTTSSPILSRDMESIAAAGYCALQIAGRLVNGGINAQSQVRILGVLYGYGTGYKLLEGSTPYITDLGPTKIKSGRIINALTGGSGTVPTTTAPKSYTKTYNSIGWGTYRSINGAVRGTSASWGDTSGHVFQGYSSAGSYNGDQRGLWIFPSITGDVGPGTITRVEIYAYAAHWYYNSGGTAKIGLHGYTGVPGFLPSLSYCLSSAGWPKPGGRWITLPSNTYAGWKSGQWRGFGVGPAGTTNLTYYGYFNGGAQLRVTYTR